MVNPCPVQLADMPHGKLHFIDLQTAIEIFTPTYQLLLTDNDFWRASNSLRLGETIGIYCAKLTGLPEHLVLLNDKHPLLPESTLKARQAAQGEQAGEHPVLRVLSTRHIAEVERR